MNKHKKISSISVLHYWKLLFRSGLFIWAFFTYLLHDDLHGIHFADGWQSFAGLLIIVWIVFTLEMVLRFFPSDLESMGCQKQFSANYRPTGNDPSQLDQLHLSNAALRSALAWILLNAVIGWAYMKNFLDDGIMLLIALFYSVSDMICILFFCPFQTWLMHNRCCSTCRIYNWDYLMMFTPFLFIPSWFTWSLGSMALLLFIRWELTRKKHPEYFIESCNQSLSCACCQEKLCVHKKQLHKLWKTERTKLEKERVLLEARLDEIYRFLGKPRK